MATKKFRIAMIHHGTGRAEGGAENTVKAVSKELQKRGHKVFIITNHGNATIPKELNVIRVPYLKIPFFKKLDYLSGMVTFSLFAFFAALMKKVDIIHVHFYVDGFFPILLSKLFGIKTVYTVHGILKEETKVAKMADAVGASCRYYKEYYKKNGITHIYDSFFGVDEKLMKSDEKLGRSLRKELGIKQNEIVVTVVARLAGLKAPELVYDIIKKSDKKIHFILVGLGNWEKFQELKKTRKNLHTYGLISHDDLPKFYNASDVSMHIETVPGICIAMLESISCGIPVISATPKGGADEAVDSSVGFQSPLDSDKISKLINSLPKNKRKLSTMRNNTKGFLEKRGFLWRIAGESYEKIYEKITR